MFYEGIRVGHAEMTFAFKILSKKKVPSTVLCLGHAQKSTSFAWRACIICVHANCKNRFRESLRYFLAATKAENQKSFVFRPLNPTTNRRQRKFTLAWYKDFAFSSRFFSKLLKFLYFSKSLLLEKNSVTLI